MTERVSFHSLIVILLILFSKKIKAQFPEVCANNVTKSGATCCPIPPGFVQPCGGPGRGRCTFIDDTNLPKLTLPFQNDDRLNWPKKFIQFACLCSNNFDGYQCTQCAFGFDGVNCDQRRTWTRKNALDLDKVERKLLQDVLNASKYTPSGWVAMNISSNENVDPIKSLQFTPVSVYDFFVYNHVFSSRSTLTPNPASCTSNGFHLDFAHEGAGFLTWHRLQMMYIERDLRNVAKTQFDVDDFALPYWDWVGDGRSCEVCTDDLFGTEDTSSKPYPKRMRRTSPFYSWKVMCPIMPGYGTGCRACDPSKDYGYLYREYATPENPYSLPTKEEVDFLLTRTVYDTSPYDSASDNRSFRTVLEGFANKTASNITSILLMHNAVHSMALGHFGDRSSSPNDPLFLAHHAFVDKLFERFLRKSRPSVAQLPLQNAPVGHLRYDRIVPYFPAFQYTHDMVFIDSRNLGYDFDTMDLQHEDIKGVEVGFVAAFAKNPWMASSIIEGILIGIGIIILVVWVSSTRNRRGKNIVSVERGHLIESDSMHYGSIPQSDSSPCTSLSALYNPSDSEHSRTDYGHASQESSESQESP